MWTGTRAFVLKGLKDSAWGFNPRCGARQANYQSHLSTAPLGRGVCWTCFPGLNPGLSPVVPSGQNLQQTRHEIDSTPHPETEDEDEDDDDDEDD